MSISNMGMKIVDLRKQKRVTQAEMANAVGTSPQAVSKWERGQNYPDIELIPIIAHYFDISIDFLFD